MSDMKHTPEPWEFHAQGDADEWCLLTAGGKRWVIAFRQNGELLDVEQEANARRIVACVNACAGINTEALEELGPIAAMMYSGDQMARHQRDDLLAALYEIERNKDVSAATLRGIAGGAIADYNATLAAADGGAPCHS